MNASKINDAELAKMLHEISKVKTIEDALQYGELIGIIKEKYENSKKKAV